MSEEREIIFFVTRNTHKFHEVTDFFLKNKLDYKIEQLNLIPTEIQADSINEIALYKLQDIKDQVINSFFIEDAGFFIDKPLNGFPGPYSSYVFKTLGNEGILKLIDNFDDSKAHFTSVIAFYDKELNRDILFEGKVDGKISSKIRGSYGFGYDPIFIPKERSHNTFGELAIDQKNEISHRARALKKFLGYLRSK